ncbi:MAG: LysR substrate-binding domain-containing protein [Pseudomonadota bacterium]
MRGLRKDLPPLDLLVAFEAAARHGSFTAAADEISLTQAAVSRQIRLLEESLGQQLFMRGHRSVQLSAEGRMFLEEVTIALNHIANAARNIRETPHKERVSVAATHSISTLWLLPRIKSYADVDATCDVVLFSSDIDDDCLSEDVDMIILRGDGNWSGYHAHRLLDEEIFPVCSPGYLATAPALTSPADLLNHRLIDVAAGHDEWVNWRIWLTEAGIGPLPEQRHLQVNTYPLAIQAARDGLGVALGWRHLIDAAVDSGDLVRPLADTLTTRDGYYLLVRKERIPSTHAQVFQDWLIAAAT